MNGFKWTAKLLVVILILTSVIAGPVSFAGYGGYIENPKIVNFSQGELAFNFTMDTVDTSNPTAFWIAIPANVTSPDANTVMLEAKGDTNDFSIKGITAVNGGGSPTQVLCTGFVPGESYKILIALGQEGSPGSYSTISQTVYELYFDTYDFVSPSTLPVITQTYADGYDITMTLTTGGAIYAGVYPNGITPTAEDLLNASGPAIVFGSMVTVGGVPETLTLRDSALLPNLHTNVFVLKKDNYNNVFYNNAPAISNIHTSGLYLTSAEYLNNLASNLSDDQVKLYYSGSVAQPGTEFDYTLTLYSGVGDPPAQIELISGTDFTMGTYDATDHSVTLNITATGLNKYNNAEVFDDGVLKIGTIHNNSIRPYTTLEFGMDLNQSIIDHADAPYLSSAAYNDMGTTALTDDAIDLTFSTLNVTNPGTPSDYGIEIDTHSTGGFVSADVTFEPGDYVLSVSDNVVRMSFTTTGVAKLPVSDLLFWKVTIKNPANLTPAADPTKTYEMFMQFGYGASLAQILVGGIPVAGFAPATYDYYNVLVPFSAYQTLQGNYSSLVTAYSANPSSTISISHDNSTGTEKIAVAAQGQQTKTYTLHTAVNFMSLSGITIGGYPLMGFNKFLDSFSAELANTTTVVPALTATADNPSATVSVAGSGSLPGVYTYVITVAYGGSSKTYNVNLYAHAHEIPVTDNTDDFFVTPSLPPGITVPGTVIPTTVTDADIKYLESLFNQPDFLTNPALFEQSINNILENTFKIQDENQLFQSLTKFDDMVGSMANMVNTQTDNTKVLQEVAKMSQTVEQKIQNLTNPEDALTVVEQYLSQLNTVSSKMTESNLAIEKSASEMLQKVADKVGSVPIQLKSSETQVKVDTGAVQKALDKQIQFLGKVNNLSDQYFGAENVNKIATKVTLEIKKPDELKQVAATIPPEVIQKLTDNKVDKLKVEIGGSGLTFDNAEIAQKTELVVEMKFSEISNLPAGLENNKKVVEFNVYEGQNVIESYNKPIEISFQYGEFGVGSNEVQDASIFRYNETLKDWDPVGGIVDPESGNIRVKRTHLSQYTVMKSKKAFSDADNSWAKNEINSLLKKGIIAETAKFEPKSYLTRAEFASWIAKAYGLESKTASLPFKDVSKTSENYNAIAAVYSQGLIKGKSKNTFDPNGFITEQEMAVIMGQALIAYGEKQSNTKTQSKYLSTLKTKEVASWAESDMALLMELGMKGSTDLGKGNGFVTKETAAAAFSKVYS